MDMDVFEDITRHPALSASFEEHVYDASNFSLDTDQSTYFELLYQEVTCVIQHWKDEVPNTVDPEVM